MCTKQNPKPTSILPISNAACLQRGLSEAGGVEREPPSLSYPKRERLCYADEKLLALLPDGIGAPSELLKLLIVYELLKRNVRLTFSKTER